MTREILKIRGSLVVFRVCRHGQFTTKDRAVGDRVVCQRCVIKAKSSRLRSSGRYGVLDQA